MGTLRHCIADDLYNTHRSRNLIGADLAGYHHLKAFNDIADPVSDFTKTVSKRFYGIDLLLHGAAVYAQQISSVLFAVLGNQSHRIFNTVSDIGYICGLSVVCQHIQSDIPVKENMMTIQRSDPVTLFKTCRLCRRALCNTAQNRHVHTCADQQYDRQNVSENKIKQRTCKYYGKSLPYFLFAEGSA